MCFYINCVRAFVRPYNNHVKITDIIYNYLTNLLLLTVLNGLRTCSRNPLLNANTYTNHIYKQTTLGSYPATFENQRFFWPLFRFCIFFYCKIH